MKFENTQVFNFEGAFRGLRNPMNSWNNSDSDYKYENIRDGTGKYIIGKNDMNLALRMIKGGTEQSKFLRQIFVSVDITAPRYWWSEFDTYKIGIVSNSCSTMHKLSAYPITLDMFEIDQSNLTAQGYSYYTMMLNYIECMRQQYNATKNYQYFRAMKQALPESFKQKRTITMNYSNIRNMIHQRSKHRLKEWSTDFLVWCSTLPYAENLLFYEN